MGQSPPFITFWMYYPAAFLAALGLVILYFALFHNRAKHPRCPKCWYDMTGNATTPARCPECGHIARTPAALLNPRRRWLWIVPALLLIAPLCVVFANLHATNVYYAVMPNWKLVEEARWNDTTITRYRVRNPDAAFGGERVTVRSNGKTLIDREDRSITHNGYKHDRETFLDVNNDGVKEVVIECFSGGAHCCYRVYVIELRANGPAIVADIDAGDGMSLENSPTLNQAIFDIPDQSFNYWKASHAESARPSVRYRLQDGALRIALDQMEEPASTKEQRWEIARAIIYRGELAADGRPQLSPELWRNMLSRIYAMHEEEAWELFELGARFEHPERDTLLQDFRQVLATDPWYQDLTAALAARAAGRPIPPSIVGMSGRAADAANP